MLKWLKNLTKTYKSPPSGPRKRKDPRVLDGIKAELANLKTAQDGVAGIFEKLSRHSDDIQNNIAAIDSLQKQITTINETLERLSATLEKPQATLSPTMPTLLSTSDTEEFTHLQEATLIIFWQLAGKGSDQWISIKSLVKTIYPDQDYNRVRTTIFEYMRIFEELGLIQRVKRGNKTYIALTKKGAETAKKKISGRKAKLATPPELEA